MSGVLRCSNGFKQTKTTPAFGLTLKPAIDKPGNATALSTPGCASAMSDMRRITASDLSNEVASGNCAKAIRYCLSWVGTNPVGTLLKLQAASQIRPTYITSAMALFRMTPATPREYLRPDHSKKRLKGRKNQPKDQFITRDRRSGFAPCGWSSAAD